LKNFAIASTLFSKAAESVSATSNRQEVNIMPIIIVLFSSILALAVWQEKQSRDSSNAS